MTRQAFPPRNVPFVNPDGTVVDVYYTNLLLMFQRLGGSMINYQDQLVLTDGGAMPIGGGATVRYVVATDSGEQTPLNPTGPVWVFVAPSNGFLGASSGQLTLGRAGAFQQPIAGGGAFMSEGDKAELTFAPNGIGFLPIGVGGIGEALLTPTASFFPL